MRNHICYRCKTRVAVKKTTCHHCGSDRIILKVYSFEIYFENGKWKVVCPIYGETWWQTEDQAVAYAVQRSQFPYWSTRYIYYNWRDVA